MSGFCVTAGPSPQPSPEGEGADLRRSGNQRSCRGLGQASSHSGRGGRFAAFRQSAILQGAWSSFLSLRERERGPICGVQAISDLAGDSVKLPLPPGEGWGEGCFKNSSAARCCFYARRLWARTRNSLGAGLLAGGCGRCRGVCRKWCTYATCDPGTGNRYCSCAAG